MARHISLIGMMGAGKSTVAPLVAASLGRPMLETDQLIEAQEGMTIGDLFIAKGEAYFRNQERALITSLIRRPTASVLSLGGGTFMNEETRQLLLDQTVVFFLDADLETILQRVQKAGAPQRPLLHVPGLDMKSTVEQLLLRRNDTYNLAHYRVDTSHHSPHDVAQAILTLREAYD